MERKKILLHFGAVDYYARVFVNGQRVGEHKGGQTPFTFDITKELSWNDENIVVEVEDPLQLADVLQETNGLLNEEHEFKFDPGRIKEINDKKGMARANIDIIGGLY